MKLKLFAFLLCVSVHSFGQIPTGYYATATGTGYTLKTQLYNIIKGHNDNGYGGLYTIYQASDRDYYYENDGSLLDMYSENPSGTDSYSYSSGSTQRCGNYSSEGDCYNREHIVPQSVFNQASPMRNDAHSVTPSDGKVNGLRSNYPHGNVASISTTTQNGSKLGSSAITGYSGSIFEPIDEFKGDIARMYFYFATRYENTVAGYNYAMFNGTSNQVFTTEFLNMLLTWSAQDPVSQREIDRNNGIYTYQNNRNPYIDHPEYIQAVWNPTADTQAPTAASNLNFTTITETKVTLTWTAATDNIAVTHYDVYMNGVLKTSVTTTNAIISGLTPSTAYSFYIVAKDAALNAATPSNSVNVTTQIAVIDTEAPTAPSNVRATATTSNSVVLEWNAATDNIEVTNYEVYVNSILTTTVNTLTVTLNGLTSETDYQFYVIAIDAASNRSANSNIISQTTLVAPEPSSECVNENFENIPTVNSSYTNRTWSNGEITWTATDARTDLNINTRAITIRNGSLTASEVANGIHDLTVTTKRVYSGTGGTFNVRVNGNLVGTIPYGDQDISTTTTLTNIDVAGNIIVSITDNSSSTNRVSIDDFSWSCYTGDLSTSKIEQPNFILFPNPSNGTFYIKNIAVPFDVAIYNTLGQKVVEKENNNENTFHLSNLNKGVYFVKVTKNNQSSTQKFVLQ